MTDEEARVMSELGAHMAEEMLGNERFIERVVREDASLAEKIMGKLHDLMDAFKSLTSREARAEYKRLQQAEKLYLDAVEHAGLQYVEGQILKALAMDDEEEQREVEYAIKYPSFGEKEIANNMEALADMESVANIDASKLEKTGKAPLDIFKDFFDTLGNNISSKKFGDIGLPKASAKSEIRHGITAAKIASIEAIPAVIENGKVIFQKEKEAGVERIVICAPIRIGNTNYYMGVMLQRDARYQRLYLHNVVNVAIEREMPSKSKDNLLTTGALEGEDHLSITSIIQKAVNVKLNKQKNIGNISYSLKTDRAATAREEGEKEEREELPKNKYSYEALTSKDDISVVEFPSDIPLKDDGRIDNREVVARGKLNAQKQNNPNNTETSTYVRVDDIGQDVLLGTKGLDHGLARSEETARAVMKIGDILKSSVAVNELNGSAERKTEMSYVLLGACRDSKHFYVVRSVVSKLQNEVTEFDIYQISAVKAKKAETPNPALVGAAVTEQSSLISSESPTISIAELFEKVKNLSLANEVFSKDVLKQLGVVRSGGTLSDDVRYSLKQHEPTDAERKHNYALTDGQKKKGSSQRGPGNKVPSHLNDSPFAISISDSERKNNTNSKNNSEPILYSLKTDRAESHKSKYSYKALISKNDIPIVDIPEAVPKAENERADRKAIVARGRSNARVQNNSKNTQTETYVYVKDIDIDVLVRRDGLEHGLARNDESTALATMKIGDLLKNSVAVNELNERKSGKRSTDMSYVLLAVGRNKNSSYLVRIVVDKTTNSVAEISTYGLYAIKAKKEGALFMPKGNEAVSENRSYPYLRSTISIAELLDNVKNLSLANEVFSEDVLNRLGVGRSEGTLSKDVRYSLKNERASTTRKIKANA
ncbi:MAG: hypothetical protein IJD75_04350, partial [Clostridia bacterium]|nr:hypothetical protein [Clostridia bacterium]